MDPNKSFPVKTLS